MDYNKEYFSKGVLASVKEKMPSIYVYWPLLSPQTRALRKIKDISLPRILDLGCGEGGFLDISKKMLPNAEITAVDIGDFRLLQNDSEVIHFLKWNLEEPHIPLPDSSFDFINCADVIEHLNSPDILFSEIKRLLSPNGFLYVEVPDVRWTFLPHFPFIVSDIGTFNFWDDPTHIRPHTRSSIRRLIEMSGLSCKKTFYVRKWAHMLALPLAVFGRNNDYKIACLHSILGLWCGAIAQKKISLTKNQEIL